MMEGGGGSRGPAVIEKGGVSILYIVKGILA